MRRLILITAAGLALLGAGIAVAHEGGGKSVKQVAATFTATTGSNVQTSTCTGSDNVTYTTTRGRWTGTVATTAPAGDTSLSGNATVDAEFIVNSSGDGFVSGKLRIDGANHTSAGFEGVVSGGSHIAGLAEGRGSAPWSKLVANISADWSSAGGFTNGKLGGGTAGGNAVVITSGGCQPPRPPKPETVQAHGNITINGSVVSVAGVNCNVPAGFDISKFKTGDRVEIKCTSASGVNTLARISGHHDHDHD